MKTPAVWCSARSHLFRVSTRSSTKSSVTLLSRSISLLHIANILAVGKSLRKLADTVAQWYTFLFAVNAADNKQRDPKGMNCIRVDIEPWVLCMSSSIDQWIDEFFLYNPVCRVCFRELNKVKIYNNGTGIPVVEHKVEKVYVPTLIFGTLLTSSNYDDTERKVTGPYCICSKQL